jgi:hypothetical protein
MSKKVYFKFLTVIITLLLVNCNKREINTISNTNKEKITIEDFDKFYDKFHKDSIFQMSRIIFPLDGIKVEYDGEKKWSKKNWTTLKTKIYDVDTTEFKIEYKKTNDSFYQKFWIEDSGFWGEYRFGLINNKWYMVYAVEQNL